MKPQIQFKGQSYDFDKFEDQVDVFDLTDAEFDEFEDLIPHRSVDYSKPEKIWTGDEYICSHATYIDDERYTQGKAS